MAESGQDQPSTSQGSRHSSHTANELEKETAMAVVLEVLSELRRGYINLESMVNSEPERQLAQTARQAVDQDIVHILELRNLAEAHRAQMVDFTRRVRRSQVHVRLIQSMLRHARQRFEDELNTSPSTPDAGGDDGGQAARLLRQQAAARDTFPTMRLHRLQRQLSDLEGQQME